MLFVETWNCFIRINYILLLTTFRKEFVFISVIEFIHLLEYAGLYWPFISDRHTDGFESLWPELKRELKWLKMTQKENFFSDLTTFYTGFVFFANCKALREVVSFYGRIQIFIFQTKRHLTSSLKVISIDFYYFFL